ncbi:ABC transporter ATP-binding protein [Lactobacillus sp. CBA3605]|uniref:ATP-binding cassette domain-containing protein n=1 Tax=Lactobacillus sp. CBA3605 TaxID=2099788 RepID=UPI000CFAD6DA|nr:ATP-binding cassette domain-containing protein [Lactobacillus sp. CBA3605]AVK60897.1 ABC transporter ATP-binding protein [Lactobacillus sp. CBA3605]
MQIQQVSYTFPHAKQPFFDQLNFELPERQVNFLIGQNGSGKTTLADILVGLRPCQGTLTPKLTAIYLSQQLPMLTAIRVSDAAQLILGIEYGQVKVTLAQLTSRLDAPTLAFLTPLWHYRYHDLSGGQQKLVQLLLFLQLDRELVVLDEPTAFIDREHVGVLVKVIQAHPERTYLMITHDVRDVRAFSKYQVLWLADHKIKASLTRADFEAQAVTAPFLQAFQHD